MTWKLFLNAAETRTKFRPHWWWFIVSLSIREQWESKFHYRICYVCKGHAYSCCPIKYYPSCMWDCNNDFQTIKHERLSFNCSHSLQSIILLHHILRYWRNVNNKAWFCIDAVEEIPFQLELNGESEKKNQFKSFHHRIIFHLIFFFLFLLFIVRDS